MWHENRKQKLKELSCDCYDSYDSCDKLWAGKVENKS